MVGVLIDNLKTALTSETTKLIQLSLWVLVQRGHSDVERSSFHANTSSWARNPAALPLRDAVKVLCRSA